MLEIRDGKKILTTPISAEDLADIHIGDIVYLNGSMTTCRDVAHRRLVEGHRELPVNSVDAPSECSFYFPAVITEGNVTVAVSTGGASPALAAALKRYIASRLHENLNEICKRAETLRGTMPAEEYAAAVQKLLEDES